MTCASEAATLLESELSLGVFGSLFERLYEVTEPVVPLLRIMHWTRRLRVDCPTVDGQRTLVFGGYVYNFSSFHDEIGATILLKPVGGAGSEGIATADDRDDLRAAWERSSVANVFPLMAEEFIEGEEVSVETQSVDGKDEVT